MAKETSVDKKEMELFSKLADNWWSKTVSLHKMNDLRIPFIHDGLKRTGRVVEGSTSLSDVQILEVGCGGGILAEGLARKGYTVTGIDPCKEMIDIAKSHASNDPELSVNYIETTIEEYSSRHPAKYDAVVASEVLEHVSDPGAFLRASAAALKPGGSIFITTINRTCWSWFLYLLLFEYILRVIPYGTHLWSKFISPEEVSDLLIEDNCITKLVKGMMFIPFKCKWYWISSLSAAYALHAIKEE